MPKAWLNTYWLDYYLILKGSLIFMNMYEVHIISERKNKA